MADGASRRRWRSECCVVKSAAPSRCLVLGAGLLGSHVALDLSRRGHLVEVFSRSCNPWASRLAASGVDIHTGSIEHDRTALAGLVERAEVVVHAASSSKPPSAAVDPIGDIQHALVPSLRVLEMVARLGRQRLVLCSSGGTIYGNPSVVPTPETHPLRPATPYAITHAALEHYADFYERERGLEVIRARFSNIFGPGEMGRGNQGVIGTWLHEIASGEAPVVVSDLEIRRDFLYVDDAASAVGALIDVRPVPGAYNVGSGVSISLAEVLGTIAEATGVRAAPIVRATSRHATGYIAVTQLDTRKIQESTGWTARTSFADGVRQTWAWIQYRGLADRSPASPQSAA
jgi:UDP-glucose 4-epimerase